MLLYHKQFPSASGAARNLQKNKHMFAYGWSGKLRRVSMLWEGMEMRSLMRLSGLVLIAFMLLALIQPQPPAPISVPRAEVQSNGVVREGGSIWIDLNRADEELLTSIPGVGPVLAGRIRAFVNEKGALTAPEELLEVEGIGPAKLREIEAAVVIIP